MREAVAGVGRQVDVGEHLGQPGAVVGVGRQRPADEPGAQRLGDDVADPHPGVERRARVLEHELHLGAQEAEPPLGQGVDPGALEPHLARGRTVEAGHQPDQGRLARAGFADDPQPLAAFQREVDPGERAHLTSAVAVGAVQVVDPVEGFAHGVPRSA